MSRQLTPSSTLENLKKEAKRWLKALRANDHQARARFERALPHAPADPTLRDVQHALAAEHGLPGWTDLTQRLTIDASVGARHARRVASFLELACADPILANGPGDHARRRRTAMRILTRYPEIARDNIHTAVVCGDLAEVERILTERPEAAVGAGGPLRRRKIREREKLWTPLLHLCYGRLPLPAASDNAVAIARALLDRGANPNDYFEVGTHPNRYTTLCGIAGEGEDDAPPHPQREALAALLLERGAEPYDIQVFYNTHFRGDVLWLLKLIYDASINAGRVADWDDPSWSMLSMGGLGSGARFFLGIAVEHNNLELALWVLTHGASPAAPPSSHPKAPKQSLHELALRQGFFEMADLLLAYGAAPAPEVVRAREGSDLFTAVCFHLDRDRVKELLEEHPDLARSPAAMFAAAKQDRDDVVAFLLDLGVSPDVEDDSKQRALHIAADSDAFRVAELLIEHGADLDAVETNWNGTPLDRAEYGNHIRMIELLSGYSRDVFRVTHAGNIERLRALLRPDPGLANLRRRGETPLMWLPDDEALAVDAVSTLLAYGADPDVVNDEGFMPADIAERRGLYEAAELLRT
jgi:ankyrin repeat protein